MIVSIMTYPAPLAFSLPQDGNVESGSAIFEHPIDPITGQADPNTLNIITADNTVINFQTFNIMQNEAVNFIQLSSASTVLNRVVGPDPSEIYGALTANGVVFLVNPNGVWFGPTANVNVNNLIASTLDISTNNFINQNYVFEHANDAPYSQILNEGTIVCTSIALMGSSVDNKGIITARAGIAHLASGDKTTVAIDQRGFIGVEINEKTSGKVYDQNGVAVKDAIANSGTIEGAQVIMSAKTANDIFENAVNQNGVVKATGMTEVNGVIKIVADNRVKVSGTMEAPGGSIDVSSETSIEIKSNLNAKGTLDIKADKDITVDADIYNADGAVKLYADYDNDGVGSFTQVSGTIEAAGSGDVYIDGSGVMTLNGIIATEYGAIKIGAWKAPDSIEGFPQYIHRKGDINITEKYDENGTKVLKTDRQDVLRYNSRQGVSLEATQGAVKDFTNTPLIADSIKIKANSMEVQTQASYVEFYKNFGDLYISASRTDNDVVTVDGEGVRVTYLKSADVTFGSDNALDTDPAVILTAQSLKLGASRFGTGQTPVITDTLNLTLVKINGDIDIRESLGIGTSILLRGPPDGGFGQIIYPKSASLTLRTLAGNIVSSGGTVVSASSIILSADNGNIVVYGTLSAPEGTVTLWTCKSIDIRYGTVISKEGGFIYNPDDEIAVSWIGGTGNWNTGSNWSGGNVPNTNGYNVTIDQLNAVVTMDIGVGVTIGQLTIGSTSTSTLTLAGALTLSDADGTVTSPGSLTIGAYGTLAAAGYAINVAGNWSNSGTFNHGNNTVTFNGTNQFISGNATFYNLTCVTPGTMLVFEAGSLTTIANTLTIEGAPNNNVVLQSSASGTENRFNIYINAVSDSQGNPYLNYITVDGSDALGPVVPIPAHNTNISGDTNSGWDADRYWVGGTGSWSDATNHWAATSGGSPGAGNIPVAGDSVFFDSNSGTGTVTINSAGVSVLDLNETSTNITIATSTNGITVTGNMTVNKTISGATAVTFSGTGKTITGGSGGGISAPLTMGANTTVDVASGAFTISGIIGDGASSYSLTKTGAGQLTLSGNNTFDGGLTIKAGTVQLQTSANAAGTGTITLGDTSGSAAATLQGTGLTFANPIVLATGTTGTLTIQPSATGCIFSGGVTGTNNLTLNGSSTFTLTLSTATVNNVGTITNVSAGTANMTITSVIGANVTGVVQNSSTSLLYLGGNNSSYANGATIKAGRLALADVASAGGTGTITLGDTSGSADATLVGFGGIAFTTAITVASGSSGTLTIRSSASSPTFSGAVTLNNNLTITNSSGNVTLSGAITGTGNITLSSAGTNTITLSNTAGGGINHTGTITNSGAGTGTTTISGTIGTNVTGVIQNSATSQLTLSGANTFTSGLTIKAGTVLGQTSTSAFGGSGTGVVTIGDTSGTADARMQGGSAITYANPITVASGSSGTLSIGTSNIASTFSGAVTLTNNLSLTGAFFTITGGITGTGNLTIANNVANGITISTNTVNMIGTITNAGTGGASAAISAVIGSSVTGIIENATNSTLVLSGNNLNYANGVIIKQGTVSLSTSANAAGTGTITIGDGTVNADATLNFGGYLTYANPITVAAVSSGTLTLQHGAQGNTWSGAITLNNNLIIANPANESLTITGGITGTGNITISNTGNSGGTTTLSSTSINNTGTITNSGSGTGTTTISSVIGSNVTGLIQNSATSKLVLSGNNSSISGDVTISAGTLELSGTTNLNVAGDWSNSGTFTANSSTVTFNAGSGTQTLNSGGSSFYGLAHSGVGILQLITNGLTVTSALVNSASTFDLNGKNLTTTGATFTNSATIKLTGDETIGAVNPTLSAGSIVEYSATSGTRDIKNWTYTSATVKINGAGTFTLPGALSCAELNIAAGTFQQGTSAINVSGNLSISSGATFTKSSNSSSLTLTGAGNISDANAAANDLGVVVTQGTGTTTMTNNLMVTSLSIGAGTTFNLGAGSYTLTVTGTGTPLTTNASGTFNGGSGSTVLYTGTTTATNIADVAYVNLTLTPTGATTYSLLGDTVFTGSLTISANATLDTTLANSYRLTVGGDWANSGTFTARSGTVTFDGAGSSTLSGSNTFYDFNCVTAGKTLNFESGSTQTVTGTLTITGASGNLINLRRSGGAGLEQWSIKPQGTVSVSYVDVANSNNTGADQIYAPNSFNSGNNVRWSYSAYAPPQNSLSTATVRDPATLRQGESILYRKEKFKTPLMLDYWHIYNTGSGVFL